MPVTATDNVDLRVHKEESGNELPVVCGLRVEPNADLFVRRDGDITTMHDRATYPIKKDLVFCQSQTVCAIPPAGPQPPIGQVLTTDQMGNLPLAIIDPLTPTYIPTTKVQTECRVTDGAALHRSQKEIIEHEKKLHLFESLVLWHNTLASQRHMRQLQESRARCRELCKRHSHQTQSSQVSVMGSSQHTRGLILRSLAALWESVTTGRTQPARSPIQLTAALELPLTPPTSHGLRLLAVTRSISR